MKNIYKITIILLLVTFLSAQTFDDYFRLAAERDPGLQAAYKTVEIALEKAAQVAAFPNPNLSFGYFVSPVETRVGPQQFKLSLTQMFPWFGTLKAQKQAAALQAEAAYQSFLNAKNTLYYDLAAAYYPLLERTYILEKQKEIVENLQSLKVLSESKLANGKGSLVNVLRIDRMIEAERTELRILEEKKIPLEAAFNAFLDREAATPVVQTMNLKDHLQYQALSADSLFTEHPALEAMDLSIRATEFKEKAVVKSGLPSFGLGVDYVAVGDRTDMVVAGSGKDVVMPMLTVSLPLARGKYRAAVKTVQLERERLEQQKDAAENGLRTAFARAEFELKRRQEQLALIRTQIETTQRIQTLLYTQYVQDGSEVEELLRVWRELLNYEKQSVTVMSEIHIAKAKLLALTARVTL